MDLQIYIQPAPDAFKFNFKATQLFLLHQTLHEFKMLPGVPIKRLHYGSEFTPKL